MLWLFLGLVVGVYMAWNIGANDVANAMGTSVGSKALNVKQAALIASILTIAGAFLVGKNVTKTIGKGIVDPIVIGNPLLFVIGAFSALLAASIWLTIATWSHFPVSTTHSIVGAMAGFGLVAAGFKGVNWIVFLKIVLSWVISPIAGGVIAFILFKFISKRIFVKDNSVKNTINLAPYLVALIFLIVSYSIISQRWGFSGIFVLFISLIISIFTLIYSKLLIRRFIKKDKEYTIVENIFKKLQILTASFIAFANGSNDVANAIGPVAAIITFSTVTTISAHIEIPKWLLFLGGLSIAWGVVTWGYKVMATIGKRITDLTPSRGYAAQFSAAAIVLIASQLGMPVSTTHTVVGAVIGVGFARGISSLNLSVIKNIIISWIVTVPIAAILSMLFYKGIVMIMI